MERTPVDPQFVFEHAAHVRALAARLVFDGTRSEDLQQETWLAALRNAPRAMTSPRGWLARIAQRRAVHDWRAESRREARERAVARPEPVTSSEEVLEREETRASLVRAVLALDEPYRSALVAQFLEERSSRAAAQHRRIPVETQRTHVKRGLELLRARLERGGGPAFHAFQLALVRDLRLEAPFGTTMAAASAGLAIGGITMWTAKKLAVAGALALAVALGVTRPWEGLGGPSDAVAPGAESVQLASVPGIARPGDGAARSSALEAPDGAGTSLPDPIPTRTGEVVVRARVVDERGRPIAAARAELVAEHGPWNAASPAGTRFEALSGPDGSVRLEASAPTATSVVLRIDGGPDRTLAELSYSPAALRRIGPGETDAGEIVLRPAGRLTGRVTAAGIPVAGVDVQTRCEGTVAVLPRTVTDEAGRFRLEHLAPQPTRLRFESRGFVLRLVAVDPRAAEGIDIGDVELERASSIAGTVVDERGEPVEGITLVARSPGRAGNGQGRSGFDGAFEVFFDQPGEYDLMIAEDARFLPWGGRDVAGARFRTGDRDVRVVLARSAATTFRVVEDGADGDPGGPVTEFGLRVRRASGRPTDVDDGYGPEWPPYETHPTNEVTTSAEPGVHEVFLAAPGRVPLSTIVAHDDAGQPVQTLRLERGGSLRGRIVRGGEPLPGAQVEIVRALVPLGPAPQVPGSIELGHTHAWDVASFAGRRQRVTTDPTGAFEFAGLATGTWQVTVALDGVLARTLELVRIPARAQVDLGDVAVARGATLRGRLDAGGSSPAGWQVEVVGLPPFPIEREDGRFEFSGIPAGEVRVQWSRPGALGLDAVGGAAGTGRELLIQLAEGETRELVLDARALGPARFELRVLVDGERAARAGVHVAMRSPDGSTSTTSRGTTDDRGVWSGLVEPGREAQFLVMGADGTPIALSDLLVPAPGEQRVLELDTRTGGVVLELAEGIERPDSGSIWFDVAMPSEPHRSLGGGRWHSDPERMGRGARSWSGHRLEAGRLPAGTWSVKVEVYRNVLEPGRTRHYERVIPTVVRSITVRPGATTVVAVP